MKKILVLLSTYNGRKFLKEQCESIFAQTGVEVDILARDDGSSDDTYEYLKELNVKNIIKGENAGACGSFLELIEKAPLTYDYYALCDQDDVWDKDKLLNASRQLDKADPERPALYYCGQTITDAELNPVYVHKMDPKRSVFANCIFNQMAGCTAVFNQKLLSFLKKDKPENIFGHDVWVYRLNAALDGSFFVDENPHISYRQHGNNVVGLSNGLKSKISRAKDYIFRYNSSDYARELIKIFPDEIKGKNKEFFEAVRDANNSSAARKKLLRDFDINFNDKTLKLLFKIKVHLKKL